MYFSGIFVVKDAIGEIMKRLQPLDLVSFGVSCSAARRITRSSKAVKRAACDVINTCPNRKEAHKLQKKRLEPWTILTLWAKGLRFEQEQLEMERELMLKIMALGHPGYAEDATSVFCCQWTRLRLYAEGEFRVVYTVNTVLKAVECKEVEYNGGWRHGKMVNITCEACAKRLLLRLDKQLAAVLVNRIEFFGHHHVRWWKL
jgi:hypothetical protein